MASSCIFSEMEDSLVMEVSVANKGYLAEVDSASRDDWTYLLQQFDDASIYQTWSYGSVRWGENSLSHHVIRRSGEVTALAQIAIKKVPFFGAGIAYIPWGPLWRKKGEPADLGNLRYAIRCLSEEYVRKRGLFLRIAPNLIENGQKDIATLLKDIGFRRRLSALSYRTLLLDLSPSLEELRQRLDQKWRNMLNQAEKRNLQIVEGTGDELYRVFLDLQREMQYRKKYIPGVDYNEFGEIQKDLPDSLKMRTMICKWEGEPVSAAVFSAIGDTGIYLLGATGDKGMKVRGAYLLQWRAIQLLKDKGCKWYDLGGINPEANPGVYHFKEGMSGSDVCHVGQFESCENFLSLLTVNAASLVRSASQQLRTLHLKTA